MRKDRQQKPKPKEDAIPIRLARALDIPEGVIEGFSQIALSGNREAIVDGCAGVLEYDSSTVKLNLSKMIVCFSGRNLEIKCMTGESVIVNGFILKIEFII
ncbi:MAG: YabP/YqfC family sporulation protein [Hydrogenoanaerobacterium sp.]